MNKQHPSFLPKTQKSANNNPVQASKDELKAKSVLIETKYETLIQREKNFFKKAVLFFTKLKEQKKAKAQMDTVEDMYSIF